MVIVNKYFTPITEILQINIDKCENNGYDKVLELGPGYIPFKCSTHTIDISPPDDNTKINYNIDVDIDDLSRFDNEYFQFGYARHIFEDIQNPDFAFKNFTRVCKSGYIETPSPLIECMYNIDPVKIDIPFRGYNHHRYIVWVDNVDNDNGVLNFIPKFPMIESLHIPPQLNERYENITNTEPIQWNTYYWWDELNPPKYKMHKNFDMWNDYPKILTNAIECSINRNEKLKQTVLKL